MSTILGLDLGTNSIGWAVVDNEQKRIKAAGSRIIPMDAGKLGDFEKGNPVSQTAERTGYRSVRRLRERYLLRRSRMLRVLRIMGFLPEHYNKQIDRFGNIPEDSEPKLAWREGKDGKSEFLFHQAFEEMLNQFRREQPSLLSDGMKIPYDWTIYYLRKKALSQALTPQELAWVLLQFNQKRGYNKLRGEEENDDITKKEVYIEAKVVAVEDSGNKKGNETWYNVHLDNGMIYRRTSKQPLDWVGKTKAFIVTTQINPDRTEKKDKEGNIKRTFRAPKDDDWALLKILTEQLIEKGDHTLGAFIFDNLLKNPQQKIIGQLVRTVDRKFFKDELHAILKKQKEFIVQLNDRDLYAQCIEELYPNNDSYRNSISQRDFIYLLADDILFYQRPLKSKKSLISDCPYEFRNYTDIETGEIKKTPIKCIAKSHPLFQEFRLWQWISNLKIYRRGGLIDGRMAGETDITAELISNEESYENLFLWLNDRKTIDMKSFLRYPGFHLNKKEYENYRWNYSEDKVFPANETRAILLDGLNKAGIEGSFLNSKQEELLWHTLYSIENQGEYEHALLKYSSRQKWDDTQKEAFLNTFKKLTICKEKDYGAYSAKAIKKLLAVMRCGKSWSVDNIDAHTLERINKIISGRVDDSISTRTLKVLDKKDRIEQFKKLSLTQACYLVYNRHSETTDTNKWETPNDIDIWLRNFKQHSLNNPIVEQIVTETLRTVRDIWKQEGVIDEIHIEMGRELKKTASERKNMSNTIARNEETNQRIRILLSEFLNPDYEIENVRPHSPSQMELFKIYESGVWEGININELNAVQKAEYEEISDIRSRIAASDNKKKPSHNEIIRYKLWLDQKYISPYTGRVIPLGKLFTEAYQIEHVIPQSKYFDDSLSNKVICESEVNLLKSKELGHEFITNHHGETVQLTLGGTVDILSVEAYEKLVYKLFASNRAKLKKMMLDEIPDDFNSRQLNDSRHISRLIMQLLSNIVRTEDVEGNIEAEAKSKNVIACSGAITDRLKQDWGINDVWNRIILHRFERLNEITNTTQFTSTTASGHTIPDMPIEMRQGFNKKRIDHRHHAMDAIVIACTTQNHVNLLNNEAAQSDKQRYDLQRKLRTIDTYVGSDGKQHEAFRTFKKPWDTFSQDVYDTLNNIIVSFKQNLRVINKSSNHIVSYKDEQGNLRIDKTGNKKKGLTRQTKGDNWAIRKALHKETVYGEVNLQLQKDEKVKEFIKHPERIVDKELKHFVKQKLDEKRQLHYTEKQIVSYFEDFFNKNTDTWSEVKEGKTSVYYYTKETNKQYFATRKNLVDYMKDCTNVAAAEKAINAITDSGIRKIMFSHLTAENNDASNAFSAEGIDRMNENIIKLNNGKRHQPIKKVRVYEQANKFAIGTTGIKPKKFVEAAKGTNLFFVIYNDVKGSRGYATVPLNIVIDLQKQYKTEWQSHLADKLKEKNIALMPEKSEILYILSPGDLVYVPEEKRNNTDTIDTSRIYKTVSMTGNQCFFLPYSVASIIYQNTEFEAKNKIGKALTGEMIKEVCIPIQVDRLGNIIKVVQ
ncbi:MAG: type II CRISPR RNA-guided endonuclease Cas9 [Bacteroidales bacterium]|nr:type II CRISPR RNA-guided endonuclease Cas9 [Bacteroidales bacterium]